MARIIESFEGSRRIIQLSSDDVISIVREYQQVAHKFRYLKDVRDILENKVFYLPEEKVML